MDRLQNSSCFFIKLCLEGLAFVLILLFLAKIFFISFLKKDDEKLGK